MACNVYKVVGGTGGGSWSGQLCASSTAVSSNVNQGVTIYTPCIKDTATFTNVTTTAADCDNVGTAENIIVVPSFSLMQLVSSADTFVNWILESGVLKFVPYNDASGNGFLSIHNSQNVIRTTYYVYATSSLSNNALSPLIDSTGWKGNALPQGAQGSQGSQGDQGAQGTQ
jgi:hypothetical protein